MDTSGVLVGSRGTTNTDGDDTINSSFATALGVLDNINGGAGTDTINIYGVDDKGAAAAVALSASATVSNVEFANILGASTVTGSVAGWTNLKALNVSAVGGTTADGITAAGTTDVTYSDKALGTGGVKIVSGNNVTVTTISADTAGAVTTIGGTASPIKGAVSVDSTVTVGGKDLSDVTVTGGTTVSINQTATNAVNTESKLGVVTVNGSADTKAVTSTQTNAASKAATVAGVVAGAVNVTDANFADVTKANSITTVTLNGFGDAVIKSGALTTLNLSGKGTKVDTTEGGLAAKTNTTLNIGLNAATLTGAITDVSNQFDTVNLSLTGASILLDSSAAFVNTALKTINISGSGSLGSSSKIADLTTASVTKIDASQSSGSNTVKVDATKATYTGGSGNDFVLVTAAATKAINGGAGSADTLNLKGAGGTLLTAATGALLTGFEVLDTTGGSATYDMSLIAGITSLRTGAVTADTTFSNVAAGTSLTLTAAPANNLTYTLKDATGKADTLDITLTSDADLAQAGKTLTANGIESVTINSIDTEVGTVAVPATVNNNTLKLVDDAVSTIIVKGNTALTLTAADVTVTSVDARGLTNSYVLADGTSPAGSSFTWASGALTGDVVVYGSTSGSDDIDVSKAATAGKTVTITVAAGTNTVKGSATLANVITGGTGADTITTGSGNDTIVGGGGADKIDSGAGLDVLTGGAGDDVFTLALNANGNTYSTIADFTKGDTINMTALKAVASAVPATGALGAKVMLADTADFTAYLNAATAETGPGPLVTTIAYDSSSPPVPIGITTVYTAGPSVVKWFQYAGNTYAVWDNNHETTFQNSGSTGDQVVKLTGLIDLTTATLTAGVLALA